MTKPVQKTARSGAGRGKPGDSPVARDNNRLTGLGFLAVVLSVAVSIQPLSVVLLTAPAVLPLRRRILDAKQGSATTGFVRWALTVFLSILACAVFAKDRVLSSFPFARDAFGMIESTILGGSGAPAGIVYILAGFAGFVALSAFSTGIAACLLASVAIGAAAGTVIPLYEYGDNLLQSTLIALPPWQWLLFAAAILSFEPAGRIGARLLFKSEPDGTRPEGTLRRWYFAGGLFVLALLLRAALAGPWVSLVRAWTVL